ncbi:putative oligopeptide transporter [Melampsora larici-populina 98AG31]|uniref:Putative oligopeptide transporter n=1 Tax=Melampsora larici-populina (strain 98AG31 / pathotype 3-4-7) TaxID=747676 RepID=F4RPY4_MELLP|nr:putative oligopeptide transporter [Melampsora larici-populina 98AG31]EGG05654.1 putative oligopeptide transporter [Melampsora larici-populina 98AG31]
MSEKIGDLRALDDERICEALSAKPTSKDAYANSVLPPFELRDQLALKTGDDLSHLDTKLGDDLSDPFDECAVLPEPEPDEDPNAPVITLRSVLVGLIVVFFGAAVSQVFMYKPVHLHLNLLFLQLASLILGRLFAAIPGPKWWNPCELTVKETVFSAIIATSGAGGVQSVEVMATLDVFFNRRIPSYISVLTILSSQFMGYGWAGVLPTVALFHSLGKVSPSNLGQLSLFKKIFGIMTICKRKFHCRCPYDHDAPSLISLLVDADEVIPEWLAPALQAISPWCLTLPETPLVTQIFGGSLVAEGLGLLAVSFDWVLVGRYNPLFVPLVAQIIDWAAVGTGVFLFSAAYRYDWFGGAHLPFISYDILDDNGARYNLSRALFDNGTENTVEVEKMGLPWYSTAIVIGNAGTAFSVSSAITAAILFNWTELSAMFSSTNQKALEEDPHRTITKHYSDFPTYGFLAIGAAAIGLAFFCSARAESDLPAYALAFAFTLSAVLSYISPTGKSNFLIIKTGSDIFNVPKTSAVVQMLGGVLFPGNAIGNLWFTLYGSTSVGQCVAMSKDLKLGQYMHLPPVKFLERKLAITTQRQTRGDLAFHFSRCFRIVGGFLHYGVMTAIVGTQRDVLLLPHGDGVFTGMALSSMAAHATTRLVFSHSNLYLRSSVGGFLVKDFTSSGANMFVKILSSFSDDVFRFLLTTSMQTQAIIPYCLVLGFFAPIPLYLLHRWKPKAGFQRVNISLFASSLYHAVLGATSGRTTATILALFTQYTIRKYHFKWYQRYNYISSAALEGGTQFAVLLLTFFVQGGAGFKVEIPQGAEITAIFLTLIS